MELNKTISSNISGYHYNIENMKLTIKFNSGAMYSYFNITPDIVQGFADAESKGKYFNKVIKNNYTYEKVF